MERHLSAARSHHFYSTGHFLRHDDGGACIDLAPTVVTLVLASSMTAATNLKRPDQACDERGPGKLVRN